MDGDPLLAARKKIAIYSLQNSQQRIQMERNAQQQHDEIELDEIFDEKLQNNLGYSNICSEYGDPSSVTRGRFSSTGNIYATVGSSGLGTVWNTQDQNQLQFCKQVTILPGANKMCDVDLHPQIGRIPAFAPNIITGSFNGEVFLWTFDPSLKEQKSIKIKPHSERVNSTRYHSCGSIFLTASYDKTWGMWDVMKVKQLCNQKGHQKEIHSLSIHPDGSLIFTGDLGGSGMVWDLRTGKGIYQITAINSILGSDFHPNGFQLAVGGRSNIVEIFDLRRKLPVKTMPAHVKLISDLKFNDDGTLLLSVSHDALVKLWHGRNYTAIDELEHPTKITSVSASGGKLACSMIDRKWTIWSSLNTGIKKEELI